MMQSYVLRLLSRSALCSVLVGSIFTGFDGVQSSAIAAQPLNSNPSALANVKSNHWTVRSLKSLAERYGCAIYSSGLSFLPSAIPSRDDMAVSLNNCLNRISHRFANPKDLEIARALQQELKPELTALKDRVDFLKTKTQKLEFNQFSPTTKLQGQAIITIQGGGFR
jgi:Carbohydrate-selective porin, OprB family